MSIPSYTIFSYVFACVSVFYIIRCAYLLLTLKNRHYLALGKKTKLKLMIVIGSGGHTTEILKIIKHLNTTRFTPRAYIVASSDDKSKTKIEELEHSLSTKSTDYTILNIPRSRKVHQSYVTSVFTTLYSIIYSIPLVLKQAPDVVLCNGPGTCVPICFVNFAARVLGLSDNVIVFVESICRVKTLSLTGKILVHFADQVMVQWAELCCLHNRVKYVGDFKL